MINLKNLLKLASDKSKHKQQALTLMSTAIHDKPVKPASKVTLNTSTKPVVFKTFRVKAFKPAPGKDAEFITLKREIKKMGLQLEAHLKKMNPVERKKFIAQHEKETNQILKTLKTISKK